MMTGRDYEIGRARSAVSRGRGIVLSGSSGVGKTSLSAAIMNSLEADHFFSIRVPATEAGRPVPFGALGSLLTAELDRLEPALAFGSVAREVARRAGRRTAVIAVDDAHLLDGPSAAVVLALVAGRHARVIITVRSGEPLSDAIVSLWKDHGVARLELEPFDRAGSATLVKTLLGAEVAGPTADLLHQWTSGNPLFLTELVRAGRADGQLVVDGGLWWWRAPLSVPPALVDLLDRRVDGLDSDERDALAAIALGEPLAVEILDRLTTPEVVTRLEDLELVRTDESGDRLLTRLDHPLLSAAVRRKLSPARRRRVAARLLEAVRGTEVAHVDAVSRAIWQLEARGTVDVDLLLRAAESIVHTDPTLSARLARRALEESAGTRAASTLADALVEAGDSAGAREVLVHARAIAASPADAVIASVALASHRAWAERSPQQAHAELIGLRERTVPGPLRDEVDSVDALVLLFAARTAEAITLADGLVMAGHPGQHHTRALLARAIGRTLVGRTDEGLKLSKRLVDAPQSMLDGLPFARGMSLAAYALAQLWRSPLSELPASDPARGRWPTNLTAGVLGAEPTAWPLFDGYVRRVAGDLDGAVRRLREALVQQSGGGGLFRSEAAAWLALSLAEAGDPDAAMTVLADEPPDEVAIVPGLLPWASAGVAAAQGRVAAAIALMEEAMVAAREAGCWLVELGFLTYTVDLHTPGSAALAPLAARIAEAIDHVDAPRLVASGEASIAIIASGGRDLLEHAKRLQEFGLGLPALRLADAARAGDAGGPAARAEATSLARTLREELGLPDAEAADFALTPREAEVAALARGGMSDREIADHLVLSVRTVETHLARVYRKLGITSRRDLTSAR